MNISNVIPDTVNSRMRITESLTVSFIPNRISSIVTIIVRISLNGNRGESIE
jgi:hypothetical protein